MHVLAAPDKFRGTATAAEVAAAVAAAAADVGASCTRRPMSDGGEGLLDVVGGPDRETTVTDPLGRPVPAPWRLDASDSVPRAVLETARANGLVLVGGAAGNDPVAASTQGVGELVLAALDAGAERLLVGVGGSATTDGGAGMLDVLDGEGALDRLRAAAVTVCCDVTTRFVDAAAVFGPQKGATPHQVELLTGLLRKTRADYLRRFGVDPQDVVGSGAAGGLAGAFAVLGARLVPGVDVVADAVGFDAALPDADLVVTGEGRLDATSLHGKVVGAVVRRARAAGVPALVIVGDRDPAVSVDGADVLALVEEVGAGRAHADTAAALREVVGRALRERGGRLSR